VAERLKVAVPSPACQPDRTGLSSYYELRLLHRADAGRPALTGRALTAARDIVTHYTQTLLHKFTCAARAGEPAGRPAQYGAAGCIPDHTGLHLTRPRSRRDSFRFSRSAFEVGSIIPGTKVLISARRFQPLRWSKHATFRSQVDFATSAKSRSSRRALVAPVHAIAPARSS
jgi:hypothetical protein